MRSLSSGTRALISVVRALPCSMARLSLPSPMLHVLRSARTVSRAVPYVSSVMKWSGWGDEDTSFTHVDKPALRPFIQRHLGVDIARAASTPVSVRRATRSAAVARRRGCARRWRRPSAPSTSRPTRWTASSTRAARACATSSASGAASSAGCPTWSCARAARRRSRRCCGAALDADAVVIPFGGGSNISGSLEAPGGRARSVVSVDLGAARPRALDRRRGAARRGPGGRVRSRAGARSSTRRAGRSATSPTASPTRRSAAGSRRARRACSPTSTATSPT